MSSKSPKDSVRKEKSLTRRELTDKVEGPVASLTDYLLGGPENYLHLDRERPFLLTCEKGSVADLPQTKHLLVKYREIREKENNVASPETLKKESLLEVLSSFNDLRVDSEKLEEIRKTLKDRLRLENNLTRSLLSKYKKERQQLAKRGKSEKVDWEKVQSSLSAKSEAFKSLSDEMLFYFERLDRVEDEELKRVFRDFVKEYLEYLQEIHSKINRFTSEEEALALEKQINETFEDCPLISKKAKELREISKNTNVLQSILDRIDRLYKSHDHQKPSLKELKEQDEVDLRRIDDYEKEFSKIYYNGFQMNQNERLHSLNQMKKSIEGYLTLRKKEKDFHQLKKYLKGSNEEEKEEEEKEMLGKRSHFQKRNDEKDDSLKKIKEGDGQSNGIGEREGRKGEGEEETVEGPVKSLEGKSEAHSESERKEDEDSLASLQNSELSDADSECSNEYILKKRQQIRKLKSLVIRKKEEQNDLVNQSDEKTSSFLHKKFSLMLLYYKLKVLGLDPETCSKTNIYLNTVKETDEMMKKTSLGKVTVSELKKLVVKCEEMKYFSQGYQKFKRLQNLFKSFKEKTEAMRGQFRGGLKITQEIKANFFSKAKLKSYKAALKDNSNGQFSIVLSRKKHSLFAKNSKKDWRNLNNKRKTKLRLGTESFNSNDKLSKKRVKEKVITAIFNQTEAKYCLCREPYELTSMIQFTECIEWFHKECIKIPKYQMKRIKTKNCPACFFLHESKCDKFPHFRKRKISFDKFMTIFKTAKVLSNFVLDERIDEIFYIQNKLKLLESELKKLEQKFEEKVAKGEPLTSMWPDLHAVASLYIYLPILIDPVETSLLSISKRVLQQLASEQNQAGSDIRQAMDLPRSANAENEVNHKKTSLEIEEEGSKEFKEEGESKIKEEERRDLGETSNALENGYQTDPHKLEIEEDSKTDSGKASKGKEIQMEETEIISECKKVETGDSNIKEEELKERQVLTNESKD